MEQLHLGKEKTACRDYFTGVSLRKGRATLRPHGGGFTIQ